MQWPASDLFYCFNSQHKNLRSSSITGQLTDSGPLETSGDTRRHRAYSCAILTICVTRRNREQVPVPCILPPGGSCKVMVLGYGVGSWGRHLRLVL